MLCSQCGLVWYPDGLFDKLAPQFLDYRHPFYSLSHIRSSLPFCPTKIGLPTRRGGNKGKLYAKPTAGLRCINDERSDVSLNQDQSVALDNLVESSTSEHD